MGKSTEKSPPPPSPGVSGAGKNAKLPAALAAALVCTGLIAEAIVTAVNARANGDLMVDAAPILGAVFLAVPTGQAWWFVVRNLRYVRANSN